MHITHKKHEDTAVPLLDRNSYVMLLSSLSSFLSTEKERKT